MASPAALDARRYFSERYGIEAPSPHSTPSRAVGNRRAAPTRARRGARVAKPLGALDPALRRAAADAPPQAIQPKDVAAGLLSLQNRGLLPAGVDLGPAMSREPAPLKHARTPIHTAQERADELRLRASMRAGSPPLGFNAFNVRLDLLTEVGTSAAVKKRLDSTPAAAVPPPMPPAVPPATVRPLPPLSTDASPRRAPQPPPPPATSPPSSARQFEQLMDTYSLHRLLVRNAKALVGTPEFASYRRKYEHVWGEVAALLSSLEAFAHSYGLPLLVVDGAALASLAQDPFAPRDEAALLRCLANADSVRAVMALPGRRFRAASASGGENAVMALAATEIETAARAMLARRLVVELRAARKAMRVIGAAGHTLSMMLRMRRVLKERRVAAHNAYAEMERAFRARWPAIKSGARVAVHIPSLSYSEGDRVSMTRLAAQQNAQMARICEVREPGVDVVYVAPFALGDDVRKYFFKVLEVGGVADAETRARIVVPENHSRFPPHFSLATMLLYSPRALQRVRNFCKGRNAYIVPSVVGPDERRLALALGLPLYAPSPEIASAFGSKSGARRVFAAAGAATPPGAHDIYSEAELLTELARLVAANLDVQRWVIKLDDESAGRGIAHFDTAALPSKRALLLERDSALAAESGATTPEARSRIETLLREELAAALPQCAAINAQWLYPSWAAFADELARRGGAVEAAPQPVLGAQAASLLIEPDGAVSFSSLSELLLAGTYKVVGSAFPAQPSGVPFGVVKEQAIAIGRACFAHGVFGHVSVAFVVTLAEPRLQAIDLTLRLTAPALNYRFFDFIVGGQLDHATGKYLAPTDVLVKSSAKLSEVERLQARERCFVANELMYYPQLPQIQRTTFFKRCRVSGVSFDLEQRDGALFNMIDSLAGGIIGVTAIASTPLAAMRKFADCLDFVEMEAAQPTTGAASRGLRAARGEGASEPGEVTFQDVIKATRGLADQLIHSRPAR